MTEKVLVVDTNSVKGELAVYQGNLLKGYLWFDTVRTHTETVLNRLDFLMKESDSDWEELNAIAVLVGPGSFTGIRIGLTVVKTIAYLKKLPVISLSNLQVMAAKAFKCYNDLPGCYTLIPGIRDEIFIGCYQNNTQIPITVFEKLTDYQNIKFTEKYPLIIEENTQLKTEKLPKDRTIIGLSRFLDGLSCFLQNPGLEKIQCDQLEALYLRKSEAEINYLKKEERKYSLYIENLWQK